MTHKCPINGCPVKVPEHILMCARHWYLVPRPIRRKVYQTWNNGRPANMQDYISAKTEAVKSIKIGDLNG